MTDVTTSEMRKHFQEGDKVCAMEIGYSLPPGHSGIVGEGELIRHARYKSEVSLVKFEANPNLDASTTTSALHHISPCQHSVCVANRNDCDIH